MNKKLFLRNGLLNLFNLTCKYYEVSNNYIQDFSSREQTKINIRKMFIYQADKIYRYWFGSQEKLFFEINELLKIKYNNYLYYIRNRKGQIETCKDIKAEYKRYNKYIIENI